MPDAMKPDIHGVRTHWIRGFMAFQLARCTRTVVLTVPVWPESGFGSCRTAAVMSYAAGSSSSGMNTASTP